MPRPLDSLAARLRSAREAKGLTQDQLAAAAEMKQSDISKLENGRILKTTGIARLATAVGRSATWLETGEEAAVSGVLDTSRPARPAHPLSPDGNTIAPQTMRWGVMMKKEPEELPDEFRVVLEDDSMAPDARAGWAVELDKRLDPRIGDDVLVRLGNKEYHYRRYRQNPAGGWIAAALDSDFASFESVKDPEIRIVAVMAFVLRPRRAAP